MLRQCPYGKFLCYTKIDTAVKLATFTLNDSAAALLNRYKIDYNPDIFINEDLPARGKTKEGFSLKYDGHQLVFSDEKGNLGRFTKFAIRPLEKKSDREMTFS